MGIYTYLRKLIPSVLSSTVERVNPSHYTHTHTQIGGVWVHPQFVCVLKRAPSVEVCVCEREREGGEKRG